MPALTRSTTTKVKVAIYPEGLPFRHWVVFADEAERSVILNATGAFGSMYFEEETSDPSTSDRNAEIIDVATISKDKILDLREIARELPLNLDADWNCQNYVINLLDAANEAGIIKVDDVAKRALEAKVQRWETMD